MKLVSQTDLLSDDTLLCFNDILLIPNFSELESRAQPSIATSLGHVNIDTPILSSPMDSITGNEMMTAMHSCGGLGILTRYINSEDELTLQRKEIRAARRNGCKNLACALGIKNGVKEHAQNLLDEGCNIICLDVAHGDHLKMYEAIEKVSSLKNHHKFSLMAGNVCTVDATRRFVEAGVDIVKVGIGPGAVCTTRRVTGFGCPQLSAILMCSSLKGKYNYSVVADGGLRNTGDMVKAIWAGADACMIGYMLAGTSATPDIGDDKMYRGMSSRNVHQRTDIAAEGVEIKMPYLGKTENKVLEYTQGIRSGLAMAGANDLSALRSAFAARASNLTIRESDPVS